MVRVQCVLWPRGPAEAAPVQAELWEPFHHGPPTALCQLNPTRVHTGMSAQAVLPLGGQLRLEPGTSSTLARDCKNVSVRKVRKKSNQPILKANTLQTEREAASKTEKHATAAMHSSIHFLSRESGGGYTLDKLPVHYRGKPIEINKSIRLQAT